MKKLVLTILLMLSLTGFASAQQTAITFQAGEGGIQFVWVPNSPTSPSPVSLTGLTVTMLYGKVGSFTQERSCVVQPNGQTATYIEQIADFPDPGRYQLQFYASNGAAILRKSPVVEAQALKNLAPTPTPTATP